MLALIIAAGEVSNRRAATNETLLLSPNLSLMASCRAKSWGDGSFQFDMNLNPILGATRRSRSDESFMVDVTIWLFDWGENKSGFVELDFLPQDRRLLSSGTIKNANPEYEEQFDIPSAM